jgi:hypothetical protein
MNIDGFVTSVEDVSNTKLSCSEKEEVVKNHNLKGDAKMFRCLTIDVVFTTIAAKTERDIVGSIVTTVENIENVKNTKLSCLEKEQVVVKVTMSNVACNHDLAMLNVALNTSNAEIVNDKGGNTQSLLMGTFEF